VTRICAARVHVYSNEFVLVTIVFNWLYKILVNLCCFFSLSFSLLIDFLLLRQTAFFAHDIIVAVWLEIQYSWELEHRVDLVISKRIEIEYDALQVHNQNVWRLCN
jgi:hypothetical protein